MSDNHHAGLGIHNPDGAPRQGAARDPMYRRARRFALVLLALLLLGAAVTAGSRYARSRDLRETTDVQAKNYVTTITAQSGKGGEIVSLPATLQGFIESPIYARTAGYVLRWNRDIGAHVAKGDVLAELDTPEVDQQLAQATAAREQAASSLELARSSAERWEHLRERDAVSQQELDERRSAYAQAQANLAAAEANMRRLHELEGFKHILAPFSGVVTRRNIDVGDLVDAGSSGGAARSLFTLSQTDPLRVYVFLPQTYAALVKLGQAVSITQAEMPGQVFHGTVSNTAGAIDRATRTLQIEVRLPNSDGRLLPGAYVDVQLPAVAGTSIVAPSNSLLFRPEGPRVAVVDGLGKVHLQAVALGRDFGQSIELLSGIKEGDQLILNPADSLAEGDVVSVQAPAPAAPVEKPKA
jgi:RND family efflux transporter MFP subunit